jgi:hypothetical protein
MKLLELSNKAKVMLDDVVHEWLNWYSWYGITVKGHVYSRRDVTRETDGIRSRIYLHRMIAGVPSQYFIRFKNGNSQDCRKENLKIVSPYGTVVDWHMSCGASPFNGVAWDGRYGLWRSHLDGMIIGYFITETEAAIAYNKKAFKYAPETVNDMDFLCQKK